MNLALEGTSQNGILPKNCPLEPDCTLNEWVKWHERAQKESEDDIDDLFYLIDVNIPPEDYTNLLTTIPLVRLFSSSHD